MTLTVAATIAAVGCSGASGLQRLSESRHLMADLLVQFTKAADAGNRAVMAVTDEMSVAFAREAQEATADVQKDVDTLGPLLDSQGFSEERRRLEEFRNRFAEYQKLDKTILDLAVEHTNIKAQQISFGSAREAAGAFQKSLESLTSQTDAWHVRALAASAVADLREIQVLQAPHIADPSDEAMTKMEQQMADAEGRVRRAMKELAGLVQPASRSQLSTAAAALDRFMDLNAQVIRLSRRNTNVRSLALALNEKGKLTAACEMTLRALQDALATRGFVGTR